MHIIKILFLIISCYYHKFMVMNYSRYQSRIQRNLNSLATPLNKNSIANLLANLAAHIITQSLYVQC